MDRENSLTEVLKEFNEIASWEDREIASHLPKNQIPVGFFCPYVPEELLHAGGVLPFRLMGAPTKISHAQAHLPPYCCYLVKSSLERYLQGELDFLKGIIFSHTCDSMQGLSDIWALQSRLPIHFNLMIPTRLNSEFSRHYLKEEIERFKDFLESHFGKISLGHLRDSIHLFNQIREKIGTLYARRRTNSHILPANSFTEIIRAGNFMDRQRYLQLLTELMNALPEKTREDAATVPIYLTGNMTHASSWFSFIEEAGAQVVHDDLCSGARSLRLRIPEHLDPMEGLIQRYLTSFFCPTKYMGIQAHLETLLKEVQESGARGVIFLLYKYCEAHFFDYPDLKTALESKGISTLLLEIEDPSTSIGQLKVRIQAFVEMLSPF
jgi:benzoyl-CoA reductase/2-hydroxyglutaryl-CoA dehydratase subunit BcrC/BadD/HgdB